MIRLLIFFPVLLVCLVLNGCGQKDAPPAAQNSSPAAATNAAGPKVPDAAPDQPSLDEKGTLLLPEETRKALGLTTATVRKSDFSGEKTITFQIFREAEERPLPGFPYRTGFAYATALVAQDDADFKVGQQARLAATTKSGEAMNGGVIEMSALPPPANRQIEVLLEIPDPENRFELAQFCQVSLATGQISAALLIPATALLNSTEGNFVYVQTPAGFQRTAVKLGAAAGDSVQVLSGVKEGDLVVTHPVDTLWLTELKLRSGGSHD